MWQRQRAARSPRWRVPPARTTLRPGCPCTTAPRSTARRCRRWLRPGCPRGRRALRTRCGPRASSERRRRCRSPREAGCRWAKRNRLAPCRLRAGRARIRRRGSVRSANRAATQGLSDHPAPSVSLLSIRWVRARRSSGLGPSASRPTIPRSPLGDRSAGLRLTPMARCGARQPVNRPTIPQRLSPASARPASPAATLSPRAATKWRRAPSASAACGPPSLRRATAPNRRPSGPQASLVRTRTPRTAPARRSANRGGILWPRTVPQFLPAILVSTRSRRSVRRFPPATPASILMQPGRQRAKASATR